MRMLLDVKIPHETFNAAVRDGSAGEKLKRILEATKPEAVYTKRLTHTLRPTRRPFSRATSPRPGRCCVSWCPTG